MTLDAGAGQSTPSVITRKGEQFAVASGDWRLEMTVRPAQAPGEVWLAGKLIKGADTVSQPTLLARLGQPATIKVGDDTQTFAVSMVVSEQP